VSVSTTTTQLNGVRSALRKRFRKKDSSPSPEEKWNDDKNNNNNSDDDLETVVNKHEGATEYEKKRTSSAAAMCPHPPAFPSILHEHETKQSESEWTTVSVAVLQETEDEDKEGDNPVAVVQTRTTLPPRDEATLSSSDVEFRRMMEVVHEYDETDVRSIEDPRWRALVEGACSGAMEPAVYRAFEVLFADLIPLRIAGRMIFQKLDQVMDHSRTTHQRQVHQVATATKMSISDIESGRFAFLSIADYKNDGDTVLNLDQLVQTGVATTVVELLGYQDFDDFLQNIHADKKGELKFDECMVALQQCPVGSSALECNPALVLEEIAKRMKLSSTSSSSPATAACERKAKYAQKYDQMVASFVDWEKYVPEGEGRRLDVLRGCFVGARDPKVVEALKIVYMDYSALRMAGDTVYSLVRKLIRKPSK
jgi:hypothetical protein